MLLLFPVNMHYHIIVMYHIAIKKGIFVDKAERPFELWYKIIPNIQKCVEW